MQKLGISVPDLTTETKEILHHRDPSSLCTKIYHLSRVLLIMKSPSSHVKITGVLLKRKMVCRPHTANVPGLDTLRPHKSKLERDKENAAAAARASSDGPAGKIVSKAKCASSYPLKQGSGGRVVA